MTQEKAAELDKVALAGGEVIQRANFTEHECLCAHALLTSKHKKDRLQEHAREFTRIARKDAANVFCQQLYSRMATELKSTAGA